MNSSRGTDNYNEHDILTKQQIRQGHHMIYLMGTHFPKE